MRLVVAVFIALAALALPGLAAADGTQADRDAARRVAAEAYQLLQAGNYQAALDKFRVAEQLVHAPPHLYYMAQAHTQLGQLLAAKRLYRQILDEPPGADDPKPFAKAREDAAAALPALDPRIPRLTIDIAGAPRAEVTVLIDGAEIALGDAIELDPGEHAVKGRAVGRRDASASITLTERAHETLRLAFEPARRDAPPEPPPSGVEPWLPAAIAAFGLGALGMAAGIVTGVMALNEVADLDTRCTDLVCPTSEQDLADEIETLGNVSTAMFIVGGAGLAAGVVLVVLQPGAADVASASLEIGPAGASLRGRF